MTREKRSETPLDVANRYSKAQLNFDGVGMRNAEETIEAMRGRRAEQHEASEAGRSAVQAALAQSRKMLESARTAVRGILRD